MIWLYLLILALLPDLAYAECCTEKAAVKPVVVRVSTPASNSTETENTAATSTSGSKAATGNQSIIIHNPTRIIVRKRVVHKVQTRNVSRKNRLLLLGGVSRTKLNVSDDGCCNYRASRSNELDLGLQYIRDLGRLDIGIAGTQRGAVYLGIGLNW